MLKLPSICALCNQYHQSKNVVCSNCVLLFIKNNYPCKNCALPLPDDKFLICGQCIQKKPEFDTVTAPFLFEEPLRTLIHEFKYHQGLYLTTFLGELMLQSLPNEINHADCLVPVPMHPKRLRKRGFNQSAELVKYLGQSLKKNYELFLCTKITETLPQANLGSKERERNVSASFFIHQNAYKHIVIIDDLLTTGSTANELAKTFKSQGVIKVDIWCCARTK